MFTIFLILIAIMVLISWRNYRMLSRWFPSYRARMVRYVYVFFTLVTAVVIAYGGQLRPPFVPKEDVLFHILVYGALAWVFGQIILYPVQPLIYVAHRLIKGKQTPQIPQTPSSDPTMTRREFCHGALSVVPLFTFGISGGGVYGAQNDMTVQRHHLVMPELSPNLEGFKIGQVSDIHMGPYFDMERLDTVIRLLAREKPDLLAITGDFADDLALLRPAIDRFNELQPSIPHGIYFCMGNHDYFHNAELVRSELNKSRIALLDNSSRLIMPGEHPFYLMGVDFPWQNLALRNLSISEHRRRKYLAEASRDVPPDAFRVLIGHYPDVLFDGFAERIPLTLAGHTHGGHIVINEKSPLSIYRYTRGLYEENGVYGYVSSGAGHWFPFRVGCPPEISMFTLKV